MIPIGDFLRRRRTPFVNWTLILANVGVFVYTLSLDPQPDQAVAGLAMSETDRFYFDWGFLPACVAEYFGVSTDADPQQRALLCPEDGREPAQLFTSMFMHAGWGHIIFNMLFLWIFGDNVEDRLGHIRYLLFYLAAGIAAAVTQTAFALDLLVPTVGASGAIAGVLGAYLLLYPTAVVQVIIFPLFFIPFFVPAAVLIGIWFIMQLVAGLQELGQTAAGAGVAWWAHIGGFVAGLVMIVLIRPRAQQRRQDWRRG